MFEILKIKKINKCKNFRCKNQFQGGTIEIYRHRHLFLSDETIREYKNFPRLRNHYFRAFSTKQESSYFEMHEVEYKNEFNLKLRRRRSSKALPDSYDDLHSSFLSSSKSWKHGTKRKRQYYK